MSRYKFRAWNGSAMVYGGFSIHATGSVKVSPEEHALSGVTKESPIMQFTGKPISRGEDIYEGDILKCIHDNPNPFSPSGEGFVGKVALIFGEWVVYDGKMRAYPLFSISMKWKKIGNIYENPELLRGE